MENILNIYLKSKSPPTTFSASCPSFSWGHSYCRQQHFIISPSRNKSYFPFPFVSQLNDWVMNELLKIFTMLIDLCIPCTLNSLISECMSCDQSPVPWVLSCLVSCRFWEGRDPSVLGSQHLLWGFNYMLNNTGLMTGQQKHLVLCILIIALV